MRRRVRSGRASDMSPGFYDRISAQPKLPSIEHQAGRREVAKRGVTSLSIVEDLQVLEDVRPGFGARRPPAQLLSSKDSPYTSLYRWVR